VRHAHRFEVCSQAILSKSLDQRCAWRTLLLLPFKRTAYSNFSLAQLKNILFICGKNKWRSPTAEHIFADHPSIECLSAGISHDAEVEVSVELIAWADLIFVMEKEHKVKLSARFAEHLAAKRIVCLNIPDRYHYMDASLIKLLQRKVLPYLA
jgi:predicted protein tyrosine phosphatase